MTLRLYDEDAYCRRFQATVQRCEHDDNGYRVVLDRTAFFPEGGGQAADSGTLGGASVTDVQIVDGEIYHYTDGPLAVGECVTGELDWDVRFMRMQKHTGEHIVSGIVHRLYGYENVGFHLGSEDVTLDFDGELTREQLDHVEDMANEVIWSNVAVTACYPTRQELETLAYRSKKELSGAVRIVTVEGCDVCACCAPHVGRTGEIGVLKLLDAIRYKGGMRIHMQCGRDALVDYRLRYTQTAAMAAALSVKQQEVLRAVERLAEHRDSLAGDLRLAKRRLAIAQAQALELTDGAACLIVEPTDMEAIREAVAALAARCADVCAVFSGTDGEGYQFAASGGDLPAVMEQMKSKLGARGGGSSQMVQGRVAATAAEIRGFFNRL